MITADDDQEFLSRLQLTLNRTVSPGRIVPKCPMSWIVFDININLQDESVTPTLARNIITSNVSTGANSQTPPIPARSRNQTVRLIDMKFLSWYYIKVICWKSTSSGSISTAANEGALANFFNSLLTRKSGGPTNAVSPISQWQSKSFYLSHFRNKDAKKRQRMATMSTRLIISMMSIHQYNDHSILL